MDMFEKNAAMLLKAAPKPAMKDEITVAKLLKEAQKEALRQESNYHKNFWGPGCSPDFPGFRRHANHGLEAAF